jgi:uncharacterized protein YijF (DUF1287 family)
MAEYAERIERRIAFLADVARSAPAELGARVGRLRAGMHTVAGTYSRDEREALALLFLPFLLVASAIVVHQSVRTLQSYLTVITLPDDEIAPLAPAMPRDVRLAAVPRSAARETPPARTELTAVRSAPEPRSVTSLGPSLAEAALPAGARAVAAPDLQPPANPGWPLLTPSPYAETPPARAGTTLALLAPLGETGGSVRPLGPAPIETLEVDDNGRPIRPGICAIDQVPRTPAPAALTLGETLRRVDAETFGLRLAKAAESQVGAFVIYNDAYRSISYPMGDVHRLFGVCTDVVVRAYRDLGIDLQALVHEARSGTGDTSIDHRRTEILRRFFSTHGESLPITTFAEDYRPGDIVTYYRPQNRRTRAHIAIVSSVMAPSGRPMIVHNRGWGPQLEDALFVDQITGHYRYRGPVQTRNAEGSATGTRRWARDLAAPVLPAAYAAEHDGSPAPAPR